MTASSGGFSFMETILLPQEQWPLVAPIVTDVFGNKMPEHPGRASFLALMNGQEPKAGEVPFLHVETVYHFNSVFVPSSYGKERRAMGLRLLRAAADVIPEGYSGMCLAARNVDSIAAAIGARCLGDFRVYRKDR